MNPHCYDFGVKLGPSHLGTAAARKTENGWWSVHNAPAYGGCGTEAAFTKCISEGWLLQALSIL